MLGRELLGALDEGRRLVLVVGALGLRQQLADPVDQPIRHTTPTSTFSSPYATRSAKAASSPSAACTSTSSSAGNGARCPAVRPGDLPDVVGQLVQQDGLTQRPRLPVPRDRQRDDARWLPVRRALTAPRPQLGRAQPAGQRQHRGSARTDSA